MKSKCLFDFLNRFVFENQIEFIQDEVMKGDNVCTRIIYNYKCFACLDLIISWTNSHSLLQYDGEPYGDSPDESIAKSAFEKLQVCILWCSPLGDFWFPKLCNYLKRLIDGFSILCLTIHNTATGGCRKYYQWWIAA